MHEAETAPHWSDIGLCVAGRELELVKTKSERYSDEARFHVKGLELCLSSSSEEPSRLTWVGASFSVTGLSVAVLYECFEMRRVLQMSTYPKEC